MLLSRDLLNVWWQESKERREGPVAPGLTSQQHNSMGTKALGHVKLWGTLHIQTIGPDKELKLSGLKYRKPTKEYQKRGAWARAGGVREG